MIMRVSGRFIPALCLTLLGTPALADLTPQQTFDSWKSAFSAPTGTFTFASQTTDGGKLVVKGVAIGVKNTKIDLSFKLDEVDFADAGNGTVAITLPAVILATLTMNGVSAPTADVTLRIEQTGQTLTASGTPAAVTYTAAAETGILTLDAKSPFFALSGTEALTALTSTTSLQTSANGTRSWVSDGTSGASQVIYTLTMPGRITKGDYHGTNGATHFQLVLPNAPDKDLGAALRQGLVMAVDVTSGPSTSTNTATRNGVAQTNATQSGPINIAAKIAADGLRASVRATDFTQTMTGVPHLPGPVTIKVPSLSATFAMPLLALPTDSDVALGFNLSGLTLDDALWARLDPHGQLPHDAISANLDITGKARLNQDVSNAPVKAKAPVGSIDQLTLNHLDLSGAGLSYTSTGSFAFDMTGPELSPGLPATTGSYDAKASGVNGLLDNLAKMGLVPPSGMQIARLMLAMLTRAGDAPDTLTSHVTIKPDGSIFANGQQIK